MPKVPDHIDLDQLKREQDELARRVVLEDDLDGPDLVAGFDAAYSGTIGYGALVLVRPGDEDPVAVHHAAVEVELPYVPGLLAYREMPILEALWDELDDEPDLLLVDGGGILHPRRIGSASHAGVTFDVPAVGVAKGLLLGDVDGPVEAYGDTAPVRDGDELLGYAYRSSRRATKPVYVSPGHRVSPDTALAIVRELCTGGHKLPEPLRIADREAGRFKRQQEGTGRQN